MQLDATAPGDARRSAPDADAALPVIPIHRGRAPREQTSQLGMIVFIASWAMLFAALFMSYGVLRMRTRPWPAPGTPELPIAIPLLATAVLAASSAILQRGLRLARGGDPGRFARHLVIGLAAGAAFLALQCSVWVSLWDAGLQIRSGLYGGMFYLLTCFHAMHALVGLLFLGWLVPLALRPAGLAANLGRASVVVLYWHFVGVVWGIAFVLLYLT